MLALQMPGKAHVQITVRDYLQCALAWLPILTVLAVLLMPLLDSLLPAALFGSNTSLLTTTTTTRQTLLPYAIAAALPAAVMARFFSPIRYYLRLTTFLVSLGANSVWGVCVSILMSLVGRGRDINWVVARSFERSTAPLVGVKFRVEGREHLDENRPAVLVGNHQTMVDILCRFSSFAHMTMMGEG